MQVQDRLEIEELLEARLRELEADRIPRFEEELVLAGNEDPNLKALLVAARRERLEIRDALDQARSIHDAPWDQHLIEIGDAVELREVGSNEVGRYVIVPGGPGVRVDEDWISDRSPVGRAVVGARLGETIEVQTPAGPARHVVVHFERASR